MKLPGTAAIFTLTLLAVGSYSSAADKIVYGADDRVEYYEVPERFREAADATVSLWDKRAANLDQASGKYTLSTSTFGEAYNLCPEVRFREQPIGAFCSGTLVGEDLVLTAGHCIDSESKCKSTAFVFGYAITAPGEKARTQIDFGDVYYCSKIIKRQWQSSVETVNGKPQSTVFGPDFALIQLSRKVPDRKPMPINREGRIKKGDRVFMTGHPAGMPFKLSSYGTVVQEVNTDYAFFVTNLDSFGGNSGGAIFNSATGLIEGILVRGDAESFIPSFEGCNIYNVRPQYAGFGVSINKLDPVLAEIPPTPAEAAVAAGLVSDLEALRKEDFSTQATVNFDF